MVSSTTQYNFCLLVLFFNFWTWDADPHTTNCTRSPRWSVGLSMRWWLGGPSESQLHPFSQLLIPGWGGFLGLFLNNFRINQGLEFACISVLLFTTETSFSTCEALGGRSIRMSCENSVVPVLPRVALKFSPCRFDLKAASGRCHVCRAPAPRPWQWRMT